MRERAWERIGHLYPEADGKTVIAWLWARTVQSPDPSWKGHVPLLKSGILRKPKKNKPVVWVEPIIDRDSQTVTYQIREGGTPGPGTMGRGGGVCVATGAPITFQYIREQGRSGLLGEAMVGVVVEGSRGRIYLNAVNLPEVPEPGWKPTGKLLGKAADSVPLYGMTEWGDLFTNRQLIALNDFSDLLTEVRGQILEDGGAGGDDNGVRLRDGGASVTAYADALVTYLAFAVDRCTDRWNSLSRWWDGGEKIQGVFGRQAIAMVWDYAEANPFSSSTGNWLGQVEWVVRSVANLLASGLAEVRQRDVLARLKEIERLVVCTDPPYYDNIQYADISDFYYVWMRRNLSAVWPEECATLATPKKEELVASSWRTGSKQLAKEHFEGGITQVMLQMTRVQDPDFPATIFYAFKQQEIKQGETTSTGWETFLQALVDAGLQITATWPVRTEMLGKLWGFNAAMLASSVVLACRPRAGDAPLETRGGFMESLREELPEAVGLLQEQAIPPVDMAQSAIGPGMRVFSRYKRVVEANGDTMRVRTALALINEVLEEVMSEEESDLDADSRFALTWYRQFGHDPGPFGDAEILSKAMNTSVSGVVDAEVAESKGGSVRLLTREELDPEWDPTEDRRLTAWELTQHLVARLDMSEVRAGELLAKASERKEQAYYLAYRLYEVANAAGRTEDAVAYNSLVATWDSLLLEARKAQAPLQQTLDS